MEQSPEPPEDPQRHLRALMKAMQTRDPEHADQYLEQLQARAETLVRKR